MGMAEESTFGSLVKLAAPPGGPGGALGVGCGCKG